MSDAPLPARAEVVVVGAGLAGLAAAGALHRAGRDVAVLEAADGVGGRVRTDLVDGFRLDRGFQVVLTAYPEVDRQLDVAALDLRRFSPGARVWTGERFSTVGDPLRHPSTLVETLRSPVGSLADKLRVLRLRRRVTRRSVPELLREPDVATVDHLRSLGFSTHMVDRFFGPLFSGIQLDPELATSARMFDTIFRCLATGDAAVPAEGMGAIPAQLAARLPPNALHLDTPVRALDAGGVVLDGGRRVDATAVIVAAEGPAASELLGLPPVGSRPVSAVYFAANTAPLRGPWVQLDGTGEGPAANVAVMTEVAPGYAPEGRALVVAACPGPAADGLADRVRLQLQRWFGPTVERWHHLRSYHIAHGQPDQRPPFHPKQRQHLGDGRWVCGDHRDTASLQGALYSGRRCGEAVAASVA